MVFTSPIFLFLFLPVTLAVNFALPRRLRNAWLLLASIVFYAVYFGVLLNFLVALLAGLGVQALLDGRVTNRRAATVTLLARINGSSAEIVPANYAFRAVVVPAGRSVIELAYWPPGLTAGAALSALSLAAVATLLWMGRRERRRAVEAAVAQRNDSSTAINVAV